MNKKFWSLFSVLLIAAMLLAACQSTATTEPVEAPVQEATEAPVQEVTEAPVQEATEPPAATEAPAATTEAPAEEQAPALAGTVTLWHSLKEGEIEGINAATAKFQEQNPDVTFDMLFIPNEDIRGKYETAAATGEGPCILIGSSDWGPAFYNAELVIDLTEFAGEDFLQTINPAALGSVRYKDAIVGLPYVLKGVVMYRNQSLVAEAPTSFDDLIAKAKEATQGDVLGADLERGPFFAFAHLTALGGGLMDENGDPTFNDEKGVDWLNMLNRFTEAGPAEFNNDNDVNVFKQGKAGIIIDGAWNLNDLAAAVGEDNLKVDPWPEGMSGYVQNDNLYLGTNVTGDDQAACWGFMEYLMTPEAQSILAETNKGFLPAVAGVEVSDRLRQEVVTAFGDGVAFPVIPEMGAYWGPMETAMKSVFDQGADPADALATAEEAVNAAIAEIRGQ